MNKSVVISGVGGTTKEIGMCEISLNIHQGKIVEVLIATIGDKNLKTLGKVLSSYLINKRLEELKINTFGEVFDEALNNIYLNYQTSKDNEKYLGYLWNEADFMKDSLIYDYQDNDKSSLKKDKYILEYIYDNNKVIGFKYIDINKLLTNLNSLSIEEAIKKSINIVKGK